MRIISGKYKGRLIKMPKGIRPTQDKVRKALFDILGDIEGLSLLELFAGSGAVGIEALSQGAKCVVFVEKERRCAEKIKDNLFALGCSGSRVLQLNALEAAQRLSQKPEKFDIIFLDPPYYKYKTPGLRPLETPEDGSGQRENVYESLTKKALQTLCGYDILAPNGFIIAQHFKGDILPEKTGNLILLRQARYGDTFLSFYSKKV